ncbi:MAG: sigma-54 factor interaction domain-containing protein, partial [Labilithrix sp.]|nr:sigma-54 factor interaction domain-containing protein [Labilithrix sp.]
MRAAAGRSFSSRETEAMASGFVASSGAMREALDVLARVAPSGCTVLVTGESGTGKEVVVRALHEMSPLRDGPFVAVNCGAIADNLVESELFGHARGAFTGAMTARRGYVAAAEGGTLFLDEVGELSPAAQVKLLRLLQQREYTPLGETRPVRCNVR